MIPRLKKRGGPITRNGRVAQCLLFAIRDNILRGLLVQKNRLDIHRPTSPRKEIYWVHTTLYMEKARLLMRGEDASGVTFPNASEFIPATHANVPLDDGPQGSPAENAAGSASVDHPLKAIQTFRPAVAESIPSRIPDSHREPK